MTGWVLAIALVVLLRWFPDLPVSRLLHRHLVERPVAALLDLERVQVLKLLLLVGLLLMAGDLVMLLGSSEMLLLYAADLALYVDALITVYTAATVARFRSVRTAILHPLRLMKGNRRRRSTSRAAARKPANDDSDSSGHRIAA